MKNKEYLDVVQNILENKEFQKLKNYKHHRLVSRYDHVLDVSYQSYLKAKNKGLDYVSAARAGLLHDFYIEDDKKRYIKDVFIHSKKALETSEKYFELNEVEKDAIINHMFPFTITFPKTDIGKIIFHEDNKSFFNDYFKSIKLFYNKQVLQLLVFLLMRLY